MTFTLEEYVFQFPLYRVATLPDAEQREGNILKGQLMGRYVGHVDGYCPGCGKSTTFHINSTGIYNSHSLDADVVRVSDGFVAVDLICTRNKDHVIRIWSLLGDGKVVKVGQYPSLADIANDEAGSYRKALSKEDQREFHKAIGLAASGVGIGSFVYLRRILERLVDSRFQQLKDDQGWSDEEFGNMRVAEKVKHLEGHIPEFLSQNTKLYGILSKGIHQLSEEQCLKVFAPLKMTIQIILEEDIRKQEEIETKKQLNALIQNFDPNTPDPD